MRNLLLFLSVAMGTNKPCYLNFLGSTKAKSLILSKTASKRRCPDKKSFFVEKKINVLSKTSILKKII